MKVVKIPAKPIHCTYCGTRFISSKNINRHIKNQHENTQKLECVYCGQICANKSNYKIHFQRKHEKEFLLYAEPRKVTGKKNWQLVTITFRFVMIILWISKLYWVHHKLENLCVKRGPNASAYSKKSTSQFDRMTTILMGIHSTQDLLLSQRQQDWSTTLFSNMNRWLSY